MKGVLARKIGMTRVIDPETGKVTPVTVLEVPEMTVLQVKTIENDGYAAAVLGSFERKKFGKNENQKFKFLRELVLGENETVKKGEMISLDSMTEIKDVKITGTSKGKGFAGVIKRWNFQRGRETHGSHHHREPGSVGMCAKPGRILKGKKMPGQYGNATVTNCTEIVDVDLEKKLLVVRGGVPGAKNSFIFVREK
ncbi:50S ribosomal protein L3 [bacterium]|jgi:large subunit ribosomal protein L3|nr:50S ribosomal protein L3 [bacterium]MBT6832429.1 50S ribosomal protein L3 [bacterium]MBT6996013.1 50S ribosomal protein L3 [bacterium]MBT7772575.1 50S ribosomal protein L3 [bacterium]